MKLKDLLAEVRVPDNAVSSVLLAKKKDIKKKKNRLKDLRRKKDGADESRELELEIDRLEDDILKLIKRRDTIQKNRTPVGNAARKRKKVKEAKKSKDEEDPNKFGKREYYVLIKYDNRRTNVNNTLNLDVIDDDVRTLMRRHRANRLTTNDIRGWYQVQVQGFGSDLKRAEKFAKEVDKQTEPYSVVIYTIGYDEVVKTIRF